MKQDGNLVVLCLGTQTWESGTSGGAEGGLQIQEDGNLVLYRSYPSNVGVAWAAHIGRRTGGTILEVQDDGDVVAKDRNPGAAVLWSTKTTCSFPKGKISKFGDP